MQTNFFILKKLKISNTSIYRFISDGSVNAPGFKVQYHSLNMTDGMNSNDPTTTTTTTTTSTTTDIGTISTTSDSSKAEDEDGKQLIASLGSLLKEINAATPSLPPGLSNPTSSEDLKILEPPADAQDKDAPRRFVFQDMRDFSPRGSFGFLAVNSSYRPYFPQGGGTKVT